MFAAQFFDFISTADARCRLRFAPTPSGFLHLGNAVNFTLNWLIARAQGGKILLRIDDIDNERKRPEYLDDVFLSLQWLGLDWNEGPVSSQDFEENWSQHHRTPRYFEALSVLRDDNLLFACAKSRRDLAEFGNSYPSDFRHQNLLLDDVDVAWRIMSPEAETQFSDFVVRRRDGIPAYQIASLCDDLQFGITHIVRGADLEASTAMQLYLAASLNESKFLEIKFLHHPLITDVHGEKLSKSAGATSLRAQREAGNTPAFVFETVANLLELPACATAVELLSAVKTIGRLGAFHQ